MEMETCQLKTVNIQAVIFFNSVLGWYFDAKEYVLAVSLGLNLLFGES